MRLPITPQISTKDGTSNRNARLTNCLKESKKGGDKAVVRPGLVLDAQASGVGHGLVVFNNELVSVYGATLGFGVEDSAQPAETVFYAPLNGDITDTQGSSTYQSSFGTPEFSSSQVICGSTSYFVDSVANDQIVIDTAYSGRMAFGFDDFTIEFWVFYTGATGFTGFSRWDSGDNQLEIVFDDPTNVNFGMTDEFNDIGAAATITSIQNVWTHVALVRDAGDMNLYINGISVASLGSTTVEIIDSPGNFDTLICGGLGYWSDFRVSDIAQYSGSFSPSCIVGSRSIPALATITGDYYDFAQSPI